MVTLVGKRSEDRVQCDDYRRFSCVTIVTGTMPISLAAFGKPGTTTQRGSFKFSVLVVCSAKDDASLWGWTSTHGGRMRRVSRIEFLGCNCVSSKAESTAGFGTKRTCKPH